MYQSPVGLVRWSTVTGTDTVDDNIEEQDVGFIGLGNMGAPMARTVRDAGFSVVAYDIRKGILESFAAAGGERAESPAALAARCRSVHVVVQDDAQIRDVVDGESGVFAGFEESEGGILVIHSTVHPDTCEAVAADAPADVAVVDAAMSGGQMGAESGELTLLVGGEDAIVEHCRPVFEALSKMIFHVGPVGTGAVAKLANNLTGIANIMTTAEGLRLGTAYDIDETVLLEIFGASSADSFIVQNWQFFTDEVGDTHPGGFEGLAELAAKDLHLTLELARDADLELYGLAAASQFVPSFWRSRPEE